MARYVFRVRQSQARILDHRRIAAVDLVEFARAATRWALQLHREPLINVGLGNDAVIVDGTHHIVLEISLASSLNNDLSRSSELRAKGDT